MPDIIDVRDFGVTMDGATNDGPALLSAIQSALSLNKRVYIPGGRLRISTQQTITYSGNLSIIGTPYTTIELDLLPQPLRFAAALRLSTTLSLDAAIGAKSLILSSVDGLSVGDLVYLVTNTPVDSAYSYKKQEVSSIINIIGAEIFLSDALALPFTVAETTVSIYAPATLRIDEIGFKSIGSNTVGLSLLQRSRLNNIRLTGDSGRTTDQLYIQGCRDLIARSIDINGGRYPVEITNASRHILFDGVSAIGSHHPIDTSTWSNDVTIKNMSAINVVSAIESHPSIDVKYEDCNVECNYPSGGIGLRCLGGHVKRCKVTTTAQSGVMDDQGPIMNAAYQALSQKYTRVYDEVEAPQAVLSARDMGGLEIRRSVAANVNVDGTGSRLGYVEIDDKTKIVDLASEMVLSRIPVRSHKHHVWVAPYIDGGFSVLNPRRTPGLGFAPEMLFKATLREDPSIVAGTTVTIPVKLFTHYGIQEVSLRHLTITVKAISSTDGTAIKKYQAILFTGSPSALTLSTGQLAPSSISALTVDITNMARHFYDEIVAEAGNPATEYKKFWVTFDVVVTLPATNRRVQYVELEVEEIRTAAS